MQLIFERGRREAPVGHALIYFRTDDDSIVATYISVPPIPFNLTDFVPNALAGLLQGIDQSALKMATPMPPIPQPVQSMEWLRAVAERRGDDLVFAGATMRSDPMRLATEAAEAAGEYGELYEDGYSEPVDDSSPALVLQTAQFSDLDERGLLQELSGAVGRLRDALGRGDVDGEADSEVRALASLLPPKYRAGELATAAALPGSRGQRLAELYMERSYKLLHEDYLDIARIDQEIEAAEG